MWVSLVTTGKRPTSCNTHARIFGYGTVVLLEHNQPDLSTGHLSSGWLCSNKCTSGIQPCATAEPPVQAQSSPDARKQVPGLSLLMRIYRRSTCVALPCYHRESRHWMDSVLRRKLDPSNRIHLTQVRCAPLLLRSSKTFQNLAWYGTASCSVKVRCVRCV